MFLFLFPFCVFFFGWNIRKYFRCDTERCVWVGGDRCKINMRIGIEASGCMWKNVGNTWLRTRIRRYYIEYHIFRIFLPFVYSFLFINNMFLCRFLVFFFSFFHFAFNNWTRIRFVNILTCFIVVNFEVTLILNRA